MRMQFGLDIRLVNGSIQPLQAGFFSVRPYKALSPFTLVTHKRLCMYLLLLIKGFSRIIQKRGRTNENIGRLKCLR